MFSLPLRILLIVGSIVTLAFILQRVRSSKVQIKDSVFWIIFAFVMLIISIFPQITSWASRVLGIQSPINFVYLFIIFTLLIRLFSTSIRISQQDAKINMLAQKIALMEKDTDDMQKAAGEKANSGRGKQA